MKTRLFSWMTLLVLLAGLLPATAAFADGNDGDYEFQGTIETLPDTPGWVGDWVVSGQTVHVSAATQINQEHGPVVMGAYVEVRGWLQGDGSVDATKVDVKSSPGGGGDDSGYLKYYGTVESMPDGTLIGDWVVSGRTIHVSDLTRIEQEHGPATVNAYVEVKGSQRTDGSMDATKIEVKMGAGSGDSGRSYTQFQGTVDSLPASGLVGDWTVGGRIVHVDAATRIEQEHGPIAEGANVEVKGWLEADTSVTAVKVEVTDSSGDGSGGSSGGAAPTKFYGTVGQLPGSGLVGPWLVSGRTVQVSSTTRIEQQHGQAVVGAYVEVEGWLQADDSVNATKIEVRDSPSEGDHDTHTSFYGTVNSFPDGFVGPWDIGGRTVTTTALTVIDQEHGPVAVGAYVEVEGLLQADGSIAATKIEVKSSAGAGGGSSVGYTKFYGVIEDLPTTGLTGDWLVSGRTVHVDASTLIDQEHGTARRGANVEVKGIQQADGSVNATKIEIKN